MIADYIHRWEWVGRVVVYIWWLCWIGVFIESRGGIDFRGNPFAGDHEAFYTAARIIWEGKESAAKIYPTNWEGTLAYRNPPFYALLYYPTAGLPEFWSAFIWEFVSLFALGLGIHWLRPTNPRRVWWQALGFYPVLVTFIYGQNTLLSFAVFALTYRLLAANRPFAAGLVAGLLCYKPNLLAGLVLWGLLDIRRKWPCALGVLTTTAVLCIGSYLLIPDAWRGFIDTFQENLRFDEHSLDWWKNQVPKGFWHTLLPTASATWQSALTLSCTLLGLVWFLLIWRKWHHDTAIMFGAVVAITLWTSTHALTYEWALILIPAILWWERLPEARHDFYLPYAVAWFGLLLSMDLCWAHRAMLGFPNEPLPQLMLGVPAIAWAGWRILRVLTITPHPDRGTTPSS